MSEGLVGRSVARAEDDRLITGRGRFLGDVQLPRMLEAAFVRSYLPHATIDRIDVDAAVALSGVANVLLASDFPDVALSSSRHPSLAETPQGPLARDKVRFVGEAVALVVADSRYTAEDAVDLVQIDYEPVAAGVPVFEHVPDDVVFSDAETMGDVDEAFATASRVTSQTLDMARQNATPMEARGCVADFDPVARLLTVYSSTQGPHRLRRDLAKLTGLRENQIRVAIIDVGGAFGQKIPTQMEDVAVALAAMALGRPVKWVEDRRENLIAAPQSRGQRAHVEIALDESLAITGIRGDYTGDAGAYSANSASPLTESYRTARSLPGVYRLGSYAYDSSISLTNRAPIAPYRGVGFVAAHMVRELAIERAAQQLGVTSREIRRRNIVTADELPYTTLTGWRFEHVSFGETYERALELTDEAVDQLGPPAAGHLRGVAVCPFVEPCGIGTRGGAEVHRHPAPSHDSARVTLDPHGGLTVSFGTPSFGQGLETTMAQIAAQSLGVRFEDVTVSWGDTSQAPMSYTGARASRSAVVSGGAVRLAALELRDQLAEVAAEILDVDAYEVRFAEGEVWLPAALEPQMTIAELAHTAFTMDRTSSKTAHAFDVTRSFDPPPNYSNGAVGAVLDVDKVTGSVTLRKLIAVEDCGQVINPMIVDGQFAGGAIQAIGAVLLEGIRYSEAEQPVTSTLMDYLLPTAADVIQVEIEHHQPSDPWNVDAMGIKGVGESGVIGVAAAVACALADALGPVGGEVNQVPMLPFRIWEQIVGTTSSTSNEETV